MVRRDVSAVAVAMLLLIVALPFAVDTAEGVAGNELNGVLFFEVSPTGNNEGFALKNYGSSSVNLNGYVITKDTEKTASKTFEITSNITLQSGAVAVFAKNIDVNDWFTTSGEKRDVYKMSEKGSRTLSLTDKTDNLYLYNGNTLLDAVGYKNSATSNNGVTPPLVGWTGDSAYLGYMKDAIRRVEPLDTDSAWDWIPTGNGLKTESFSEVDAIVSDVVPFVFPESSGAPVYDALKNADTYVYISIYMLTSKNIISLLCDLEDNGVEVILMMENKPLGYSHDSGLLANLHQKGGEIVFIGGGTDDRYSYVHNKYMIIDGDTVVITSENWTTGNMECKDKKSNGNRGWGAVVYGNEFAERMESIFLNDYNYSNDLKTFSQAYPSATPTYIPSASEAREYGDSIDFHGTRVNDVDVRMYMSPDNTYKALEHYISEATERVYSEQMDIGADYSSLSVKSPITMMADAGYRGVDARLMIADTEANEFVNELNTQSNIKSTILSKGSFATMHNKGVIIDDMVWVSSVNWTSNSLVNNRECGLLISSETIADYYLSYFIEDWNKNYSLTDVLTLKPIGGVPEDGKSMKIHALDAIGKCVWTISRDSGDEIITTIGNELTTVNYEDLNYIRVTDDNGQQGRFVFTYAPEVEENPTLPQETIYVGAGAGILLMVILLLRKLKK